MGAAQGARPAERHRGAAHRDFRQGEGARHRRAGPGRPLDHPRRQDPGLAALHAAGEAGRDDPQLRRHPPRAFLARQLWPGLSGSPEAGRMAQGQLAAERRAIRVDLDTLTPEIVRSWKQGDRILLNGKMLTGRDAAHKRIQDMLDKGEPTARRVQGPRHLLCRPGRSGRRGDRRPRRSHHRHPHGQVHAHDARAGPARLRRQGRARSRRDRGDQRTTSAAYLMAAGGAAYLVARAIKGSKVVGFEDLGMEAIYEFEVKDFPVTVAVDSEGQNVHQLAPARLEEEDRGRGSPAAKGSDFLPICGDEVDGKIRCQLATGSLSTPHRRAQAATANCLTRRPLPGTNRAACGAG